MTERYKYTGFIGKISVDERQIGINRNKLDSCN